MIAGLTALVWGLIEGSERGWTDSTILGAFAIGSAIMAAFIAWERRSSHPMLDVSVFRNLRFSAASISVAFVFFALMGVVYFLTTYLQSVMGYTALEAGVRMLPVAAGLVGATKLLVEATKRLGTKIVVAAGLGTVGSALYLLGTCGVDTGYGRVAIALSMMGVGMSLAMSPATESIMGSLPKAKAGIGSAMNDVVREVGGTLGVAVLGSVLASSYGDGRTAPSRGCRTTPLRPRATASAALTTSRLRSAATPPRISPAWRTSRSSTPCRPRRPWPRAWRSPVR